MTTLEDPRLDRLLALLPAWLRENDEGQGKPLGHLLRVIAERVNEAEDDIRRFYDDLFVETASDWAVPYLGALIANDVLYDASRAGSARTATELFPDLAPNDLRAPVAARVRADVGRTISYRRRKGTPAMLEELARNVLGWPVHLVECFELLDWTQHLEHLRPQAALLDVRLPERCERVMDAFSDAVRTVDVRLPKVGGTRGPVVGAGAVAPSEPEDEPTRVDVALADPIEPPYNVRNVAFYAWRLQAPPLVWLRAKPSAANTFGWSFSPLGNPAPLFLRWRREGDESGLATQLHVPDAIRRTLFAADLRAYAELPPTRPDATQLYGLFEDIPGAGLDVAPDASFVVLRNGVGIGPAVDPTVGPLAYQPAVICMRLDPWPAAAPAGPVIGVDVVAGRLVVGTGFADATQEIRVAYHVAQAAGFGGGGYPRAAWIVPDEPEVLGQAQMITRLTVGRRPLPASATPPDHATLTAALAAWAAAGRPPSAITILDSDSYDLPATISLPNDGWLVIEAADGERPHLTTPNTGLQVDVVVPPNDRDRRAVLTLSGVLVEGHVVLAGELGRFRLWHTTLVPGRSLDEHTGEPLTVAPSLVADESQGARHDQLRVEVAFSILGPVVTPAHAAGIWLLDSIVDGLDARPGNPPTPAPLAGPAIVGSTGDVDSRGAHLHVERSTVFGRAVVESLYGSESIFTGDVDVQRTQDGCVRFSWLSLASVTPRRHRCQPELTARAAATAAVRDALKANPALTPAQQAAVATAARIAVAAVLRPSFTTRVYGHPAYGQLGPGCPAEIANGAEDGAEMGALHHLQQAQRESNLRLRLAEYLPFGLDPALSYVT
jgi:hypothetical protein